MIHSHVDVMCIRDTAPDKGEEVAVSGFVERLVKSQPLYVFNGERPKMEIRVAISLSDFEVPNGRTS